jgi:6,7-dimethyl-8-ribityllumazine synthase
MKLPLDPKPAGGDFRAKGLRFGIVASRFNSFITQRLERAALDALAAAGATGKQVEVLHVPGSFEIPLAAKKLAETGKVQAVIAIGCVLRGETSHYEYICSEVARGVQLAQMDTGVPIIFCVLTCDTLEQAIDRAGPKSGNKGYEAGLAAVEMANLARKLSASGSRKSTSPRNAKTASRARAGRGRRK